MEMVIMENDFSYIHALNISEKKETLFSKIRSYFFKKYGIWDFWDFFPYSLRMRYYEDIRPIFKPENDRLRKSIPRRWKDTSDLIVDVNFEMIKIFYEEEYAKGYIDWDSDEQHKSFAKWLEGAYRYITVDRPKLEEDLNNAYPPLGDDGFKGMFDEIEEGGKKTYRMKDDGIPYDVKYAEVNRIEDLIKSEDTSILKEMIKKRDFLWT
jgi:hypothetical protein